MDLARAPVFDAGQCLGQLGVARDVTPLRKAEAAMCRTQVHARNTVQAVQQHFELEYQPQGHLSDAALAAPDARRGLAGRIHSTGRRRRHRREGCDRVQSWHHGRAVPAGEFTVITTEVAAAAASVWRALAAG